MKKILFLLLVVFIACKKENAGVESEILGTILKTKAELESTGDSAGKTCKEKKCVFLAIWDFDGTILKGDSSEGLEENGKQVFPGLVEVGIKKGYSTEYQGDEGFKKAWEKYKQLEEEDKVKAYFYLPQIFAGAEEKTMLELSREHFQNVLKNYYFPSSVKIMTELKKAGIESRVISASASFFVESSLGTLPLEPGSINGVQVEIVEGKITNKEIYPLTYADGKREKLQSLVKDLLDSQKADSVYVLAGFGNSYHTDGPFLKYIAEQKLDAGKPISVMINGGKSPQEYTGIFKEVSFDIK